MERPPYPEEIAWFLNRRTDESFVTLCREHLPVVLRLMEGYTRGRGFDSDGNLEPDLSAVAITATARLVVNPSQLEREGADSYYAVGSFKGWSLPELAVLNKYRRRSA